uniref:Uncharacterized protein n=1 Tax=Daphnia galeata TaxID=27404 RepID=A0A8J2RR37_9CRUS|nr:unnamed protein product [Daphnia galeata]
MKIGLIFLLAFVVITQQFYLQRPNVPMLWFSSPPYRFINYYHPLEDEHHQNALAFHRQNENPSLTIAEDNLNNTEGFSDTQSRIRGISVNRPLINDYHGGRYLINNYVNNPFLRAFTIMSTSTVTAFKTAISTATSTSFSASTSISIITSIISTISVSTSTIMNTAVLSLTLVVKCVPSFQVSPSPFACRRKKEIDYSEDSHQQFLISPSQTLKLMPTALPSEINGLSIAEQLTSSKDEIEISNEEQKLRSKRFFFNRFHQFSTLTETGDNDIYHKFCVDLCSYLGDCFPDYNDDYIGVNFDCVHYSNAHLVSLFKFDHHSNCESN